MPRFDPPARPSSGTGRRRLLRYRRGDRDQARPQRFSGGTRCPPSGEARRDRRQDPRRRRRGHRRAPRCHRPGFGEAAVEQTTSDLGEIEVLVAGAGDTYFGKLDSISTEQFESQIQIHLVGANRLATAVLPGMIERRRGDLIFVGSDVALRQRPHMGAYGGRQGRPGRDGDQLPDGAGRHGRARSIVHPGPTKTSMGWSLPAELIGPALEDWAKWGSGASRLFPARRRSRAGHHVRRRDAARRLHREHGTPARGSAGRRQGPPEARAR